MRGKKQIYIKKSVVYDDSSIYNVTTKDNNIMSLD